MAEEEKCGLRKEKIKEPVEKEHKLLSDLKDYQRKCCQANEQVRLLHRYNEIKDAAQILVGAIANIEGVTVKELHDRFQLPTND